MTRDEILSMEAGRELDAWIAEKVMHLCVLDDVQGYGDGCVMSDKGFGEWGKHPMYGKVEDPDILPPYSTDISAAFEVEEEMRGDEIWWKYTNYVKRIILLKKGSCNEFDMMHAPADTRCKAALLAVMADD